MHIGGGLIVGHDSFNSGPRLQSLALNALVSIGGDFAISVRGLHSFEMSGVSAVGGQTFAIWQNPLLESFNLASLRTFKGKTFLVSDNPKLPTCLAEHLYDQLDAPKPENKTIVGNLATCP